MGIPIVESQSVLGARSFKRIPRHVGFIPDGNRRWAKERGLPVAEGYKAGVHSGLKLLRDCMELGIEEVSVYGFTQDNTKRPREQQIAFSKACVEFAEIAQAHEIGLLVVGDTSSRLFPDELKRFTEQRQGSGLKVNMLVNYGWEWDLKAGSQLGEKWYTGRIASSEISRIEMIVRWGGCRRLSGFLPVQSVYADFFVIDDYWPDYKTPHLSEALEWYQVQDMTLGG